MSEMVGLLLPVLQKGQTQTLPSLWLILLNMLYSVSDIKRHPVQSQELHSSHFTAFDLSSEVYPSTAHLLEAFFGCLGFWLFHSAFSCGFLQHYMATLHAHAQVEN